MTIIYIAKKGYAEMAVTGCIAEPLFNMLFGLGFCSIVLTTSYYKSGIIHFTIESDQALIPTMLLGGTILVMTYILVVVAA